MTLNNESLLEGESRLYCSAVYHLVRLRGSGSDFVLPLYDLSVRVGGESGRFFARMTEISPYLACNRNQLYGAAKLLRTAGFWEVLSEMRGKAVQYKPLKHPDWVAAHGDSTCCKKAIMPWDAEKQDPLGKTLYGVTGGTIFYPQVLKGWRDKSQLTDEEIILRANEFMETNEAHMNLKGPVFRKRLGAFLCDRKA